MALHNGSNQQAANMKQQTLIAKAATPSTPITAEVFVSGNFVLKLRKTVPAYLNTQVIFIWRILLKLWRCSPAWLKNVSSRLCQQSSQHQLGLPRICSEVMTRRCLFCVFVACWVEGSYTERTVLCRCWVGFFSALWCQALTSTLSQRKGRAPQSSITFSCQAGGGGSASQGGPLWQRHVLDSMRPIRLTIAPGLKKSGITNWSCANLCFH